MKIEINEALELAKEFSNNRIKINQCREYSNYYVFSSNNDKRLNQPIYVEKTTGKVGIFNPLKIKISAEERKDAKTIKVAS